VNNQQEDITDIRITKEHSFGALFRYKPDECMLIVMPVECMKKRGTKGELKKVVVAKLRELNMSYILYLNKKYGVTFEKVNETLVQDNQLILGGNVQ
jgi:hypothetical protein